MDTRLLLIPWQRAERASASFVSRCHSEEAPEAPLWLGLEHEFVVRGAEREVVDFRDVIHGLGLGRRHLDPTDPYAYRMASGSAVTCDSREAEIALPPIELTEGFAHRVDGWAAWERAQLRRRCAGLSFEGISTHLSVTLPRDVDPDQVSRSFATRFAPGLMLLMDRPHSPGLLVRPRPGRLELGGEYAVGANLRAAAAYAVGATLACVAAVRRGSAEGLPPELSVRLERAIQRFGWYVDRRALGPDLYSQGRMARLVTIDGRTRSGAEHLEEAWAVASHQLGSIAGPGDLADADAIATGRAAVGPELGTIFDEGSVPIEPRSPYGRLVGPLRRPGSDMAPVLLTWEMAVQVVRRKDGGRIAFAAIPGPRLGHFLDELDSGRLDGPLQAYLRSRPRGRRLVDAQGAMSGGLYDELGLRLALLSRERAYDGRPIRLEIAGLGA